MSFTPVSFLIQRFFFWLDRKNTDDELYPEALRRIPIGVFKKATLVS